MRELEILIVVKERITHEDGVEGTVESSISSSQVITNGICPRDELSIEVLYETKLKERKASNA